MDLKISVLFLFSLLFVSPSYAQVGRKLRDSEIDQLNAERQIKELRQNVLLFRLRTRQPLIDALMKSGREAEAKEIEQNQLKKNRELIAAFSSYFDFCPVYFFTSNYSTFILNGALDSIPFLDDSANINPNLKVESELYFVAEIAPLAADTASFENGTYLAETEDGLVRRTAYAGGGNSGFEALIFKSSALYQLRRPFPYYSRTLQSLPIFRRSYKRVVSRANEALHYYYNKVY